MTQDNAQFLAQNAMKRMRSSSGSRAKRKPLTKFKLVAITCFIVASVIYLAIAIHFVYRYCKTRTRQEHIGDGSTRKAEWSWGDNIDLTHGAASVSEDSDRHGPTPLPGRKRKKLNGDTGVSGHRETNVQPLKDGKDLNEKSSSEERNFKEENLNDRRFNEVIINAVKNSNEQLISDGTNSNDEIINGRNFNEKIVDGVRNFDDEIINDARNFNEEHNNRLGDIDGVSSNDLRAFPHNEHASAAPDTARNKGLPRHPEKKAKTDSPLPLILWWDPISGLAEDIIQCGHRHCQVSVDRRRWKEQKIMVLSFYGSSLSPNDLPVPRREGDLWALFHDESPKNKDYLFSHQPVMELFNYTATFRDHAHLSFPTQWLSDVKDLISDEFVVPVSKKSELREREGLAPVIFVQSDCQVPSDRDHFVTMLQQYVRVDSYGSCLNNKPFPNASSLSFRVKGDMSPMTADDFYRLVARYKFAIAIENAVCPGYITEKFWRPLHLGVVPIVFGAPNIREFLPSNNSALLIDDFDSFEELAMVIHYYDEHDDEYNKLTSFKQTGITNPALLQHLSKRPTETDDYTFQIQLDYRCMLCEKLHEAIAMDKSGRPIPHSVASKDHYGCEKPGKFSDVGRYVPQVMDHWHQPWVYSQAAACVMRKLIDRGIRVSIEMFEAMAREAENTFDDECHKYF